MAIAIDPWVNAEILEGKNLTMVPATLEHLSDLSNELLGSLDWPVVHWGIKTTQDLQKKIVDSCIQAQSDGTGCGFAMIEKKERRAVGMSCYVNLKRQFHSLEIGSTWVGRRWQRSFVNTEAKLLMLTDAFERLGCQRVEFRVDSLNFNSQRAVRRLGAKFEGELRMGVRLPDGRKRDYHLYSVIETEWLNVKQNLQLQLEKHA